MPIDPESTLHHPYATAVLRGGHFDGLRILPTDLRDSRLRPQDLAVIATEDGKSWVYRSTSDMDTVYPTLTVYALDHTEPV